MSRHWTTAEDAQLLGMRAEGMTLAEIADELGRSLKSVMTRSAHIVTAENAFRRVRKDQVAREVRDYVVNIDVENTPRVYRDPCFLCGVRADHVAEHGCNNCGREVAA